MSTKISKKDLGKLGENLAARYYKKLGWKIIAQNYWTRCGELDLVLEKNRQILIVEVKTRTNESLGGAEETMTPTKISHLQKAYQIMARDTKKHQPYDLEFCLIYIKNKRAYLTRWPL
jgi:putative endonuclease